MRESTKAASALAATGSAGTGGLLIGITTGLSGPSANLGGYITAQMVASSVAGMGGPTVATAVAVVGGPVVAGALVIFGTGALIFGGVKLLGNLFT